MEFYEEEKDFIIKQYKLRVILTFIVMVILTIALTIFGIISFANGDVLVGSFVMVSDFITLFGAVCTGIYIYSRRTRKPKKKVEDKELSNI